MFSKPRAMNGFRRSYTGEYRRKRYEHQKEQEAAQERAETSIAVSTAPRFFDIDGCLSNTGERNYFLRLFSQGEKGRLIVYLNKQGADKNQIAEIFRRLEELTGENHKS